MSHIEMNARDALGIIESSKKLLQNDSKKSKKLRIMRFFLWKNSWKYFQLILVN